MLAACLLGLCAELAGCATNDPRREAALAWDGQSELPRPAGCGEAYAWTDYLIWQEMQNPRTSVESRKRLNEHVNQVIRPQLGQSSNPISHCWRVSYENHQGLPPPRDTTGVAHEPAPGYDLLVAEFDDQGERTDVSVGRVEFGKSEVALIESRLEDMLTAEVRRGGGLNIVIFTHGWHGTATATDDYSIWFKAILEQTTRFEATSRLAVCRASRQQLSGALEPASRAELETRLQSYACPPEEPRGASVNRRTVGIEIAWRGDSEVVPLMS